jgi:hypothetical protein
VARLVNDPGNLGRSIVRVCGPDGVVVGSGFLAAADRVVTCAHVVARALGLDDEITDAPTDQLVVELPLLGTGTSRVSAVVDRWFPALPDHTGDIAVLRIAAPVPDAAPVRLVSGKDLWGHRFRVLGFPPGRNRGVWVDGRLLAPLEAGWIQMNTEGDGPSIERGFSGAPVWDDDLGGVVGMTAAADGSARPRTAYLIAASELPGYAPELWPCPYRGLESFREGDADLFHGRSQEIDGLLNAVERIQLVAVAGGSGCGKTSLVRAGLIPRLRAKGYTVTRFRAFADRDVNVQLAATLMAALYTEPDPLPWTTKAKGVVEALRTEPELLGSRIGGPDGHLIFLDQFEEVVAADTSAAQGLLTTLTKLAAGNPALRIVLTARSGSLERLLDRTIAQALSGNVVLVAPLDRDGLREAIISPADSVPGTTLEPGLVDRIVRDAEGQPGRLPLVEFVLTEMWKDRLVTSPTKVTSGWGESPARSTTT